MKVGIICEGQRTDVPVLEAILASQFPKTRYPNAEFLVQGYTKKAIYQSGDLLLESLFAKDQVDRAIIVWDLVPTGDQMGALSQPRGDPPRRKAQRQRLLDLLIGSQVLRSSLRAQAAYLSHRYRFNTTVVAHPNNGDDLFKLCCVCYTLDGWLLADGGVIRAVASTDAHLADRWSSDEPDRCRNPLAALIGYFRRCPNKSFRYFNKADHNIRLANAYILSGKLQQLRRSQSFCRVVDAIASWVPEIS